MTEVKKRNVTIDVIKGLLILFVIFGHININIETRRILLAPFWENSAVPMFLLLSSYLYSKGFLKNNIETYRDAYSLNMLMPKLLRFIIPWFIFYVCEVLVYLFMRTNFISNTLSNLYPNNDFIETYVPIINGKKIIVGLFSGGEGPGSYYVLLMFIFIFIFPFLYFFVKKYKKKSIFVCSLIPIAFNLVYLNLDISVHGSIGTIISSLFTISIGIYWAMYDFDFNKIFVLFAMTIGAIYIYMVKYIDYSPKIFVYQSSRALPACLFWSPIIIYLVKHDSLKNKVIARIGRMSFDVMLVQKVFFTFPKVIIYTLIKSLPIQMITIFTIVILLSFIFNIIEKKIAKTIIQIRK